MGDNPRWFCRACYGTLELCDRNGIYADANDNWPHAGTGAFFPEPGKKQRGCVCRRKRYLAPRGDGGVLFRAGKRARCRCNRCCRPAELAVAVRSRAARQAAPAVRCAHSEKPRISPWKSKLFPGIRGFSFAREQAERITMLGDTSLVLSAFTLGTVSGKGVRLFPVPMAFVFRERNCTVSEARTAAC